MQAFGLHRVFRYCWISFGLFHLLEDNICWYSVCCKSMVQIWDRYEQRKLDWAITIDKKPGLSLLHPSYILVTYCIILHISSLTKDQNSKSEALFLFGMCSCSVVKSCPTLCDPPGSSVMGFSRQEHWSGLPLPSPGDLPNSGIELSSPVSCISRWILYHWATWES